MEWMNFRGLGFLIAALSTAGGGKLRLAKVGPKVEALLELTVQPCFGSGLEIYKTVEEAVSSFK